MSRNRRAARPLLLCLAAVLGTAMAGGCKDRRLTTTIKVHNSCAQSSALYVNSTYSETVAANASTTLALRRGDYTLTASTSSTSVAIDSHTVYLVVSIDSAGDLQRP